MRTLTAVALVLLGLGGLPATSSAADPPPAFTTAAGQGPSFDRYAPGLPAAPLGLRWRRDLGGLTVGGRDEVLALRSGAELSAVDWDTGLTRWRRVRIGDRLQRGYGTPSALASDGDTVVVVSGDEVYARDVATGTLRWSATAATSEPGDTFGGIWDLQIAIARDTVVVQVVDGYEAFDVRDGRRLWHQEVAGSARDSSFAVDDGTVVIGSDRYDLCVLQAIDLRTGALRWIDRAERPYQPCLSGVVTVHDGMVHWRDWRRTSDGSVLRPSGRHGRPAFSGDRIFYDTYDGPDVTAADAADGRVRWTWDAGPDDADGALLAATGPRTVLTSRRDSSDETYRTSLLQLLDRETGAEVGAPLRIEGGAGTDSTVVGDDEILAAGSVVAPGGSPVSFPGTRVLFAGWTTQPPVPKDEFDTRVRTARPSVPFRLPPGTTAAECRVDNGVWEPCTSPWTTPDLDVDGEHTVDVRHAPAAPAARLVLDLDREAPSLSVTGGVSGTVGASSQPFPSFRLASDDPLASFECQVDDEEWSSYCGASRGIDTGDGPHVLRARSRDRNGNRSAIEERRWTVDLRPPTISIAQMPRPVRTEQVEIPFTVSDDAVAVRCTVLVWKGHHEEVAHPTAPCSGAWRGTLPEGPAGDYTSYRLAVAAEDRYGNTQYDERGFNLDVLHPGYRRVGSGDVVARKWYDGRVLARVEVDPDDDVRRHAECRLAALSVWRPCAVQVPWNGAQGTTVELPVASGTGPEFSLPREDGRHEVLIRGVDMWGVAGETVEVAARVDAVPPVIDASGVPTDGAPSDEVRFPLRATDVGGTGVERLSCSVVPAADPWSERSALCDSGTFHGTLFEGENVLRAVATDVAGNETTWERRVRATAAAPGPGGGTTTAPAPTTTPPPTTTTTTTTTSRPPTAVVPGPRPVPGAGVVARPVPSSSAAPSPTGGAAAPGAPCPATRASAGRPPRITAAVRRAGRVVVRATVPGASARRPARVEVQVRRGCGAWRSIRSTTARGSVRLVSPVVADAVDAVRIRARPMGRTRVSASRTLP